jgi:hypothetical protein
MAGEDFAPLEPVALAGLRFGLAEGLPLEGLDDTVAAAFAAAINALDGAGVRITREELSLFDDMPRSMPRAASCRPKLAPCIATGSSGAAPTSTRMSACASSAAVP